MTSVGGKKQLLFDLDFFPLCYVGWSGPGSEWIVAGHTLNGFAGLSQVYIRYVLLRRANLISTNQIASFSSPTVPPPTWGSELIGSPFHLVRMKEKKI